MDINNHLKHINLDSIKRDRTRPLKKIIEPQLMNIAPIEPKIMNITPTEKAPQTPKIQFKAETNPPKIGVWRKILNTLKQIIFRT